MTQDKDQYRDTVFLPKTEFPMRGELPKREPEILAKWEAMDLYAKIRAASKDKKKWILHDGPPYANGNIHMGHAVNKILKDVVVKSWQMMGYNAPYVPGWDCHGLPIEWKIEEAYREKGLDKDSVDKLQFRDECRKFAKHWVDTQSGQFQRLGVSGDWKNPYLTMHLRSEAAIAREIHKFADNGMLYRGAKPVMWSTVEKTALAEAEIEYQEHKSITIWVRFPVVKTNVKALEGADIVIWTTTPWTIPSNRAIAYNPEIEYAVYRVDSVSPDSKAKVGDLIVSTHDEKMSVFNENGLMGNTGIVTASRFLQPFLGAELNGTICHHPLHDQGYDFKVPLLAGDFVTADTGTGFVHIAPGHGEDDFNLVIAHNNRIRGLKEGHEKYGSEESNSYVEDRQKDLIEVTDNVADDGTFRPHVPLFAGLEVYTQKGELGQGNFAVLKALQEAGKLLAKGSMKHEYPHSWRSKAPLIFRTTPQWFIAMEGAGKLRDKSLKAISETQWIPAKGEARITSMIQNRPDWCISRQRAWGVPIALFVHKDTKEVLKDQAVFQRIFDIFEKEGSDAWWVRPASDFLGASYKADVYEQIFDIVDVWFESGSTHAFVVEDRADLAQRADLYLEGSDQHRGWFHSSLLESCGTRGVAPYKAVLTHGFVLDEKGYKMSKSLGNVVDPLEVMQEYGADILRLWTLSSDYSEDIRIGKDSIKSTADLYRRIRNTLRFLLGALDGFTKDEAVSLADPKALPELEQLVLHQLSDMDKKVRGYIRNYEFLKLTKELHDFCNENLSAFYFDIRKDSLYCDDPASPKRRACRSVMAEVFACLTAWLAPVLAFTAEEAWGLKPEGVFEECESVHLREFPSVPGVYSNAALAEKWVKIAAIRESVTKAIEPLRADKQVASSLEAAPVVSLSADDMKALDGLDLAEICITAPVRILSGAPQVSIEKASGAKCERCWKVLEEVSEDLCNRCTDAVEQVKKAA